jgi:hypothetical protein
VEKPGPQGESAGETAIPPPFGVEPERPHGRAASIVPDVSIPYTEWGTGNAMSLFSKIFDTRTLVKIIGVLSALLVMKAVGVYLGFSWMAALASG